MKICSALLLAATLGVAGLIVPVSAQTDGDVALRASILDYGGSSTKHWTVVWVENVRGAFIKTLWRQGPTLTKSHWNSHCGVWYSAKNGSTAFDGYSSSTAPNYSSPNSPIILTWDCRDASGHLVADGDYKFWIQYAEDNGQGPYTASGLLWTKGPDAGTLSYPNQGANFTSMRVSWSPISPPPEPPVITSAAPTADAVVGVPYQCTCSATGDTPISFSATGLPPGLHMNTAGIITGIPTEAGDFGGAITAVNGVAPDATQAYTIAVTVVPVDVSVMHGHATNGLVMSGSGPANGVYSVLTTTNLAADLAEWTVLGTDSFDSSGSFSITNEPTPGLPQQYYLLRIP